jgi:hypothetical protein
MNETLQQFARQTLKDDLALLPEASQQLFKLMYGRLDNENNELRSAEEAKAMSINDVVDQMPASKLDWVMQQAKNTLKKNERQQPT